MMKKKKLTILLLALPGIIILLLLCLKTLVKSQEPKFVSPISDTAKDLKSQTAASENNKASQNINYYINLSASFLKKATQQANNTNNQTLEQKRQIISNLNKSLTAANQAVKYFPDQPEGYLMRAAIYQRTAHLYPEAETAAKNDLQTAAALSEGQALPSSLPNQHPLNSLPSQRAELAAKITIAEPNEEKKLTKTESGTENNASSGTAVIPAGEKTTIIHKPNISKQSLLYTKPMSNPENISLHIKERTSNSFTVEANKTPQKDLKFKWWVIATEGGSTE